MKTLIGLTIVGFTTLAANAGTFYQFTTINVPNSLPHTTVPSGINNLNVIAGYYADSQGLSHGFTYDTVKNAWVYPIDVHTGSENGTFATTIDDSGDVAGFSVGPPPYYYDYGFVDINGAIGWAPILPCVYGVSSQTNGINNSGYTVGSCLLDDLAGGGTMSWVYYNFPDINPVAFDCPYSGVNSSGATAINNNLQVVGWYYVGSVQGGYLANYNNCVSEINFPGAIFTTPSGINDTGWVIGTAAYSNSPYFGFLYNTSSHQFTTITPPSGAVNGFGTKGLNNNSFWVGWYLDKNVNLVGFYATHPLIPPIL